MIGALLVACSLEAAASQCHQGGESDEDISLLASETAFYSVYSVICVLDVLRAHYQYQFWLGAVSDSLAHVDPALEPLTHSYDSETVGTLTVLWRVYLQIKGWTSAHYGFCGTFLYPCDRVALLNISWFATTAFQRRLLRQAVLFGVPRTS